MGGNYKLGSKYSAPGSDESEIHGRGEEGPSSASTAAERISTTSILT